MNILFIARATLYTVYGGDTVQIISTAKYLRTLGVTVDIRLSNERIDYTPYDLLHLFNIIRPADLLKHAAKSGKPYVVSTIFVDFTDYEKTHRHGAIGLLARCFSNDAMEYIKAWARWIKNGEAIGSLYYILHGHKKSIQKIANDSSLLLPNSVSEYDRFVRKYPSRHKYAVIYNGLDLSVFNITEKDYSSERDKKQVICVARIEGKKNQLNLIRALNNTEFELTLIGAPAPNHKNYYETCKKIAGPNIHFVDFIPQEQLIRFYLQSKVHILPSWNETCGLSSLEAAFAGCNIVITDKGDTREYYGTNAWYCDPGDTGSIYKAVQLAAVGKTGDELRNNILNKYNWLETAKQTLLAYQQVLGK